MELFDRSTRIPRLTAAGERLLLEAEAVVERCLALEGHAQSLSQQIEASLRLAIEVPGETVMPVLKTFEQAFPHVDLLVRNPSRATSPGWSSARRSTWAWPSPNPSTRASWGSGRWAS